MDNSVLESSTGLFDLEAPIHGSQQPHLNLRQSPSYTHWCPMGLGSNLDNDQRPMGIAEGRGPLRKVSTMSFMKGKTSGSCYGTETADASEDEEPIFTEDGNDEGTHMAKCKKSSPWQRMKWTDNVIRLLIAVVARVGDDGGCDGMSGMKRKSRILQKKGKWKTVSKIMNSKGAHVSPQQCEDKFNDLNKRYKKLNDVLGKGTSCKVVENPDLMDQMPQLSTKAKDMVRKILNSKHLFYKEMCAYHNDQPIPNCPEIDVQGCFFGLGRSHKEGNMSEDEGVEDSDPSHDDNDDDDESNESYDEEGRGSKYIRRNKTNEGNSCHLSRTSVWAVFEAELGQVLQNPKMAVWEKKSWIDKKRVELSDQTFKIQAEALEIDKQRFKWLRYRSKKDYQFESLKLDNEKLRVENEHSLLILRSKQLELELQSSETAAQPHSHEMEMAQERIQLRGP